MYKPNSEWFFVPCKVVGNTQLVIVLFCIRVSSDAYVSNNTKNSWNMDTPLEMQHCQMSCGKSKLLRKRSASKCNSRLSEE